MVHGWLGADWGTVPAWIGSILTGSSILLATLTYRRSVRDRAHEQEYREGEQARRISAWIDTNNYCVCIENSNDVALRVQAYFEFRLDSADKGAGFKEVAAPPRQRILADMAQLGEVPQVEPLQLGEVPQVAPLFNSTPALLILDAAGCSWLRDGTGSLRKLFELAKGSLKKSLEGRIVPTEWEWSPR